MTKTEAIAQIQKRLPSLSTEQVRALADLTEALSGPAVPEDDATRAAIAEGLAQADQGEFVSVEDVGAAFARFRP
jgi:predicted transcriptional regulator